MSSSPGFVIADMNLPLRRVNVINLLAEDLTFEDETAAMRGIRTASFTDPAGNVWEIARISTRAGKPLDLPSEPGQGSQPTSTI